MFRINANIAPAG